MSKFSMTQMKGVIPAMITLFDEHENVDVQRTRDMVEFLIARGVDGLYLTGSTGEGFLMDQEERKLVVETVVDQVKGRIPVIVSLNELDKKALVRIISEPKNSLVRQYQKLFEMDGVRLTFAKGSMEAIAELALERSTGARGLRAIMENLMQSTMYEIPARKDVAEVVITPELVRGKGKPKYILLRDSLPESNTGA